MDPPSEQILIPAVLVFIKFTVQILALIPIFLFRWILSKIYIFFKPDLIKIVDASSCAPTYFPSGKDEAFNLIISVTVEGKLNYEEILRRVSKMVYHSKPGQQRLLYPEFQMYYERWFGFPFWKIEEKFCVENHVRRAVWPTFDLKFETEYLRIPFQPTKSPWEVLLVEKEGNSENWKLLLKFHHYLADGFSVFSAFGLISDNYETFQKPEPKFHKNVRGGLLKTIKKIVTFPFIASYEMAMDEKDGKLPNPWVIRRTEMTGSSRVFVKSDVISCEQLKKVTRAKNVSFTSVLMAGVSGGIRNYFENEGIDIPEHISTLCPAPVPNHGEGLCNEYTSLPLKLPTGCKDSERRLELCENNLVHHKTSTAGARYYYLNKLFGCLPLVVQSKVLPDPGETIQFGIFPGPTQQCLINRHEVTDLHYTLWWARVSPLIITVLSYNGGIRLLINSDPAIFPTQASLQVLVREIEKEFETIIQNGTQPSKTSLAVKELKDHAKVRNRNEHMRTAEMQNIISSCM